MSDNRPNILWLCTDQQRFDTLGCYGNPYVRTPHLDKLAAELTAYENFVRPHRSYLVNMDHIQSISYRGLQLTDQTEIPIPHGRFSAPCGAATRCGTA